MEGGALVGRQRRREIPQLVRVGLERVVIPLTVDVFDVDGVRGSDRLVAWWVPGVLLRPVRVALLRGVLVLLDEDALPPVVFRIAVYERDETLAVHGARRFD